MGSLTAAESKTILNFVHFLSADYISYKLKTSDRDTFFGRQPLCRWQKKSGRDTVSVPQNPRDDDNDDDDDEIIVSRT